MIARRTVTEQQRRADEIAALAALRGLEDVVECEWLSAGRAEGVRTPDLRLVLGDGREVAAEVTMVTNRPEIELLAAARRMWPMRSEALSWEWTVCVSDHDIAARDASRRLKDLVAAMLEVLAGVEQRGGTAREMQSLANRTLDPDPYNPYVSQSALYIEPWLAAQPWDGTFEDWARAHLADHCDYWYPPDIVDCLTDSLYPRHVRVLKPPVRAGVACGGVYVGAVGMEHGFFAEDVGYLVPAVQAAIDHKHDRAQLRGADAHKWLVVALDGGNAAGQLEACYGPGAESPYADLSDALDLRGFDEVWIVAKTFHGGHLVVLRLSNSGGQPQAHTIENAPKNRSP